MGLPVERVLGPVVLAAVPRQGGLQVLHGGRGFQMKVKAYIKVLEKSFVSFGTFGI